MNKQHPLYQEDLHRILDVEGVECLSGKRFLITGATGLVGVQLIDALMLIDDVEVIAVGRSLERASKRLGCYFNHPRFRFLVQDVCEPFSEDLMLDYIIPLASNTHPRAYAEYPVETLLVNILGCKNALELARRTGAMLLYPSTVEVYGNARGADVFTEDYTGQLNLNNSRACYPESKRASEALCLSYAAEYGVRIKIVRLSRIFGPTMLLSDTKASSQFILKALAHEDIILKSEGVQFFSYTYTADAANAMLYVLLHGEEALAYNVAAPSCDVQLRDFAHICADIAGTRVAFEIPDSVERCGYSVATKAILSPERLFALGWHPRYDLNSALQRTITIMHEK